MINLFSVLWEDPWKDKYPIKKRGTTPLHPILRKYSISYLGGRVGGRIASTSPPHLHKQTNINLSKMQYVFFSSISFLHTFFLPINYFSWYVVTLWDFVMRILVWLTLPFGKMLNTFSFGYLQICQYKRAQQWKI